MAHRELLREKLQEALEAVDGQASVVEALQEIVWLLATLTVSEDVMVESVVSAYRDACQQAYQVISEETEGEVN